MGAFNCGICGEMWFSFGPPHRCFDTPEKALRALIAECEFANAQCVERFQHTVIDLRLLDAVRDSLGERSRTFCGGWPTLREAKAPARLVFEDEPASGPAPSAGTAGS